MKLVVHTTVVAIALRCFDFKAFACLIKHLSAIVTRAIYAVHKDIIGNGYERGRG